MSNRLDKIERGFALLALTVGVLGFGAVGLCGGYFTVSALPPLLQGHLDVTIFLLLSVPCLTGGIFMVKHCVERIRHLLGKPAVGEEVS
jgi:hypothetical protein